MKVLVVGTNYGATYLRALALQHDGISVAGILSNGSARSKNYAQHFNVPHYTKLDEIPNNTFDCACVAVLGEIAVTLSIALLDKNIHVLCEHPLGSEHMSKCLEKATEKNCIFNVNGHFSELPSAQSFFTAYSTASQQSPCLHLDLSVNLRTLYSGLDIIGRAIGTLSNIVIENKVEKEKPSLFEHLTLTSPDKHISLLCQNFSSEKDDGSSTLINHRVSAIFPHGNLLMAETNGPVMWFPTPVSLPPEAWRSSMPIENTVLTQYELAHVRDLATLATFYKFVNQIYNQPTPPEQTQDYLYSLATLWGNILQALNPQS